MDYYLCSVGKKGVLNQHKTIYFDQCNQWVLIKYDNLNGFKYNFQKVKNKNPYYILCTSEILVFCQIDEKMSIPKGNLNKLTGALILWTNLIIQQMTRKKMN